MCGDSSIGFAPVGDSSATQAFFQLAVAAIPGLLFGGAVLDSRRRGERDGALQDGERVLVYALVVIVVLAGPAELRNRPKTLG
jgi:hypothetical protein